MTHLADGADDRHDVRAHALRLARCTAAARLGLVLCRVEARTGRLARIGALAHLRKGSPF